MSNFLIVHIATSTAGYLVFAIAFVIACLFIYREKTIKSKNVNLKEKFSFSLDILDKYMFTALTVGFILLSVGIPTGALLQRKMFGSINMFSPRLAIPSVLWLFYLIIIYARYKSGYRGRVTSYLVIFGGCCTMLSLFYELYRVSL